MTKTWIDVPIDDDEWGGEDPPDLETGFIMFCPNGHQWWERISSPDKCPACGYATSHYKPSTLRWLWHLLREGMSGTPVVTHAQYNEEKERYDHGK